MTLRQPIIPPRKNTGLRDDATILMLERKTRRGEYRWHSPGATTGLNESYQ